MGSERLFCSLVALTLLFSLGNCIVIDVYRNGRHVQKYEDDTAEAEGLAASLPGTPLKGQMYYAVPYRNACEPIHRANETTYFNWVGLIDNYSECPDTAAWNLYNAGYGMMLAYSRTKNVGLFTTPPFPRAIVTRYSFIDYLRNNTIIGISPNASEYYIKVRLTNWDFYEKLFMIFGGVLLAAVSISIVIFCGSIFCRTVVQRWRTRGLSRWRVRQLPKRKYKKEREVCESCSICLEDFRTGENLRVLPCEHIFHPSCVDEWLQKWNRTCPLCKSTIQRRKRGGAGGGASRPSATSSSASNQEHARLLSHEEERESETLGGAGEEGREVEGYGATGHLESPLTRAPSDVVVSLEGTQGESVSVTLEVPEVLEQSVEGKRRESNLAQKEDVAEVSAAATGPLNEKT